MISSFSNEANEPSISVKRAKQLGDIQEDIHDDALISLSSTIATVTEKDDETDFLPETSQSSPLPSDIKGNEEKEVSGEHLVFHQNDIGLFLNKLLTVAEKLLALRE